MTLRNYIITARKINSRKINSRKENRQGNRTNYHSYTDSEYNLLMNCMFVAGMIIILSLAFGKVLETTAEYQARTRIERASMEVSKRSHDRYQFSAVKTGGIE